MIYLALNKQGALPDYHDTKFPPYIKSQLERQNDDEARVRAVKYLANYQTFLSHRNKNGLMSTTVHLTVEPGH